MKKTVSKKYPEDPIAEIRQIREELVSEADGDTAVLCRLAVRRRRRGSPVSKRSKRTLATA